PVTLELGGKSPTVIDEAVALGMAAERICFGKTLNAGQTCVAPDYVLLPDSRRDAFVEAMRQQFTRLYPSVADNEDYTSVIDDRHFKRLQAMLDDARDKGATLVPLNAAGEAIPPGSRKLPLTLVLDPTDAMTVMREEIFGPILPVLGLADINDALAYVNARPRPLAMNLFVDDGPLRQAFLHRSHAGGVCINDAVFHVGVDDLPFGGTGDSGMGSYHGKEGFVTFSHPKSVFSRPRLNTAAMLYPPYGGWLQKLVMKLFLR
ncbi:MAG: aldehyde dehydrogenase family protein, partial [Pseudomonadota bacterium]